MKKTFFIIFFICIHVSSIFSQLEFKIYELRISRIIVMTDTVYVESMPFGPRIEVSCKINNNTDLPIILNLYDYEVSVLFNYQNEKFEYLIGSIMDYYSWRDNKWGNEDKSIMVLPDKNYELFFTISYLEGADFVKTKRLPIIDCTREVIETLPTLRVRYKDTNIDIITSEIKNIIIDNFIYNLDKNQGK